MKLSYNKVFDRYTMSFSDKLAEFSYSLYRTLRLQLAKIFPLSEHEKYWFDDDLFSKEEAGKRIAQLLDDPKSKLKQIVVVGNEVIIVYEREYSLWY